MARDFRDSPDSDTGTSGLIGRHISVVVMGNTDRDHPIEDAIMDAAHKAGDQYGFDVTVGSGPYYYEGDETDRKLAEVTAERDRLAAELAAIKRADENLTHRREWSVLRPERSAMPLTPIGPPFYSGRDVEHARQRAARTFSADVLTECPLAYMDVTETEFRVVGVDGRG